MHGMAGMHQQHMKEMQADLEKMRGLLSQMRSSMASMNAKDQAAMKINVQMWQALIDQMDREFQHMQMMMHGGMGGPHGEGMMHQHGPEGATPPPPGPPQ
jgi:hypothetical protein